MRKKTEKSAQLVFYGGTSFFTFILTILAIAYPSFEGNISSLYGYLGSGLAVGLLYSYRKENASGRDNILFVLTGWLFSAGALLIGILGYIRKYAR